MTTVYPEIIPFFSIIVCTLNRRHLLHRALDSLCGQTERDWECIIVDDGSTDNTCSMALEYIHSKPEFRIRYMHHINRGTGLSRNAGILAACGRYISFLDSDDEYKPNHLEIRRAALLDNPDIDVLHGGVEIIGNPYVTDKDDSSKKIHISDCIVGGTLFVKTESAHYLHGFAPLRYGDDSDFYSRATAAGFSIGKINAPTYIYHRDSPDSLCTNQFSG